MHAEIMDVRAGIQTDLQMTASRSICLILSAIKIFLCIQSEDKKMIDSSSLGWQARNKTACCNWQSGEFLFSCSDMNTCSSYRFN